MVEIWIKVLMNSMLSETVVFGKSQCISTTITKKLQNNENFNFISKKQKQNRHIKKWSTKFLHIYLYDYWGSRRINPICEGDVGFNMASLPLYFLECHTLAISRK